MSHFVDVVIKDGDRIIANSRSKPVRVTPDGHVGVVHGGVVYPLREGNCVDVNDPTLSKTECPTFLEPWQEIIYYVPDADGELVWSTEFGKGGNYLVFDGDEELADELFEHLTEMQVAQRLGASFRPAKDGYQYDWFIRIRPGFSEAQVISATQSFDPSLASGLESNADTEVDPDVLREGLRGAIELLKVVLNERNDLRDQLDQQTTELNAIQQKRVEANATILAIRGRLQEATDAHSRTQSDLAVTTIARDAYKNAADAARASARGLRVRQSIAEQIPRRASDAFDRKHYDQLLLDADKEIADRKNRECYLIRENERLGADLSSRDETIAALAMRVDEQLKRARDVEGLLTRRMRRDQAARVLGMMADCFLARVRLEEEDLFCLGNQVKSPRRFLELLRDIDRQVAVDAKAWSGSPSGVKEISKIHVGNPGAADMGRLYFRGERDGSVRVALHVKEDSSSQERFVSRRF